MLSRPSALSLFLVIAGGAALLCLPPAGSQSAPAQSQTETREEQEASRRAPASPPPHLQQAETLVTDLQNAPLNVYGGGAPHIVWSARRCEARTVCASFITLLMEHTYGWTRAEMRAWLRESTSDGATYHDAIEQENGFRRLRKITSLRPGDILAMRYADGSKDTGHVALIDAAPRPIPAAAPLVQGTTQYEVTVIDSSASGHGPDDTRRRADGSFTGGIGRGVLRLYADGEGRLVGYAWSTTKKSKYYTAPARDLDAGRLTKDYMGHVVVPPERMGEAAPASP